MASTYDIGDIVRVASTFTDTSGSNADPTAVYFAYETPDGTAFSTSYGSGDITKATTGAYYYDITTTGSGQYEYRFTSTGSVTASAEGYFSVRARRVST